MTRAERFGCEDCPHYIWPSKAGIRGSLMETGRCLVVGRSLRRVKWCPRPRKESK